MKVLKIIIMRGLTIVVATLAACIIAELALRMVSDSLWPIFVSNSRVQGVNKEGADFPVVKSLRGGIYFEPEMDSMKDAYARASLLQDFYRRYFRKANLRRDMRIVLIGDSISYGLPDQKHLDRNFSWLLEKKLIAAHPQGPKFAVANFSFGSYSTFQEVIALERHGIPFRPHLVILEFTANDFTNFVFSNRHPHYTTRKGVYVINLGEDIIPLVLPIPRGINEFLCEHMLLARLLNIRADSLVSKSHRRKGSREYNLSRQSVFKSLDRLRDLSRLHKFNILIVFFPITDKPFERHSKREYPYFEVDDYAKKHGIPVFDLIAAMKGVDHRGVSIDSGGHLNREGHRIVADKLFDFIMKHPELLEANPPPIE